MITFLAPAVRWAEAFSLRREDAGAFEDDVDAEVLVRQLARVLDRGHLELLLVGLDRVAVTFTSYGNRPCTLS